MIPNKHIIQLIVFMYAVYLLGLFIPITQYGIIPRSIDGLIGVFTAPFLHRGIWHLVSNTIPLFVLLSVLHYFYPKKTASVVVFTALVGGLLVWVFARKANHIGASGLIYGLAAFLITYGFLVRKLIPILVSIVIAFLYGSLIWGIFPSFRSYISWEGHLFGAVSGVLIAFLLHQKSKHLKTP